MVQNEMKAFQLTGTNVPQKNTTYAQIEVEREIYTVRDI